MKFVDFIKDPKAELAAAFLQKKSVEFADFETHEAEKNRVAGLFRWGKDLVADSELQHADRIEALVFFKNSDIALSIFSHVKANPQVLKNISGFPPEFLTAFALRMFADEIVKLSARELSEAKAAFESFKKDNRAVLVELKLI
jgi:hypothetical protein